MLAETVHSGIDWTTVVVASIAGLPGTLGVVLTYLVRREQRIPSGGTIGEKVERTHDLAAASVAHTSLIVRREGTVGPEPEQDRRHE